MNPVWWIPIIYCLAGVLVVLVAMACYPWYMFKKHHEVSMIEHALDYVGLMFAWPFCLYMMLCDLKEWLDDNDERSAE